MKDLRQRLFKFSCITILFLRTLPSNEETRVIKNQLIKSASSAGANYEESQGGSYYWLRLIKHLRYSEINEDELSWLLEESIELKRILGAINQKTRREKSM